MSTSDTSVRTAAAGGYVGNYPALSRPHSRLRSQAFLAAQRCTRLSLGPKPKYSPFSRYLVLVPWSCGRNDGWDACNESPSPVGWRYIRINLSAVFLLESLIHE